MDNFDNIFDKFNDEALGEEQWLEPTPDVYGRIENEISDNPRKRLLFWWILSGISIILISLCSFMLLNKEDKSDKRDADISVQNYTTVQKDHTPIVSSTTPKLSNIESVKKDENELSKKTALLNSARLIQEDLDVKTQIPTTNNHLHLKDHIKNVSNSLKANLVNNKEVKTSEAFSKEQVIFNKRELVNIQFLDPFVRNENIRPNTRMISLSPKFASIENNDRDDQKINKPWSGIVGIHYLNWSDKLNENYRTALSPADFNKSDGSGQHIYIGIDRELTSKVSGQLLVGYSNISTSSGHNSILNYDNSSEVNLENKLESVTLATPYGFVNSDISIRRDENASSDDVQLFSAIHSKHNLRMMNVNMNVMYQLISLKRVDMKIGTGLGYHRLLELKNDLDYINTNHSEYSFVRGAVTENQMSLNNGFFSSDLMLTLGYILNDQLSSNLRFDYSQSLSPLFNDSNFSSTSRYYSLGLQLMYRL